jgi:hypothetical protein
MKAVLVTLTVLLAGATVFYAHRASELRKQLQQPAPAVVSPSPAPPPNLEIARLRKLLDEREAAYIQIEAAYRHLQRGETNAAAPSPAPAPVVVPPAVATNRLSWTERLKLEDPERYKQMMAERDQRRKQMEQWYQERVSVLDQRAATTSSQEEAELATKIAENLAKLHDLGQQWSSIRDLPEDQREAAIAPLRDATRETYQTLRTLGQLDRQLQLGMLAQSMGYTSASDKQKFINTVGAIYRSTDYTPRGVLSGEGGGHRRNN